MKEGTSPASKQVQQPYESQLLNKLLWVEEEEVWNKLQWVEEERNGKQVATNRRGSGEWVARKSSGKCVMMKSTVSGKWVATATSIKRGRLVGSWIGISMCFSLGTVSLSILSVVSISSY